MNVEDVVRLPIAAAIEEECRAVDISVTSRTPAWEAVFSILFHLLVLSRAHRGANLLNEQHLDDLRSDVNRIGNELSQHLNS